MSGLKAVQGVAIVGPDGLDIRSVHTEIDGAASRWQELNGQRDWSACSIVPVTVTISASGEYERGLEDAAKVAETHTFGSPVCAAAIRTLAGKREQEGR